MRRLAYVLLLFGVLGAVLSACASGGAPASGTTPPTAKASGASDLNTPTPQPAIPVAGTVKEVTVSTVTLDSDKMFSITTKTQVLVTQKAAASDLKAGQYVEVTAKKQADSSLLASTVDIFDDALKGQNQGQRAMTDGSVMVNGTIDTVQGDAVTLKSDGGGAKIKLAPDAAISKASAGKLGDIKVGTKVAAALDNTVAHIVSVR
jgi:hypothetical protein